MNTELDNGLDDPIIYDTYTAGDLRSWTAEELEEYENELREKLSEWLLTTWELVEPTFETIDGRVCVLIPFPTNDDLRYDLCDVLRSPFGIPALHRMRDAVKREQARRDAVAIPDHTDCHQ